MVMNAGDVDNLMKQLGRILIKERQSRKLTIMELSRRSGVDRATIYHYEGGARFGSVPVFWRLAQGLDMKLSNVLKKLERAVDETARVRQ